MGMELVTVSTQQFSLLLFLSYTFALLQSGLSTGHFFFFFLNIHLFQHGVFHRLHQIICCVMEHLLLLLLSPWYYLWCLSPFSECASTGDTGLAAGLSCVLQWVHLEAKWIWCGAHLGLSPQKPPCSFHLAHIYTQYMVLHMWRNNSDGCLTPSLVPPSSI